MTSEAAVWLDAGHGPGVAVGDAEVAVVASGGDPVADAEPLTGCGGDRSRRGSVSPVARRWSRIAALRAATCSRVSAMTSPVDVGECGEAFDLGGVDDDLAARESASKTSPGRSPVRISRLRSAYVGVGEPVHGLELEAGLGACPAGGVVEDAAAADGRELVAVADERDPGAWSRRRW